MLRYVCFLFQLDAWLLADQVVRVKGSTGCYSPSEASKADISAHERLTDEFINFKIAESDSPELDEAKVILERIQRRDLYTVVAEIEITQFKEICKMSKKDILDDITTFYPGDKKDLAIVRQKIVPGMNLDKVRILTMSVLF